MYNGKAYFLNTFLNIRLTQNLASIIKQRVRCFRVMILESTRQFQQIFEELELILQPMLSQSVQC